MYQSYLEFAVTVFLGFFAIVNPISNIPVFINLTAYMNDERRKQIAFRACLIAFCIIVVFSVAGKFIFYVFGITLAALRVTGGILVFVIGYQMIMGNDNNTNVNKGVKDDVQPDQGISMAITPLAMPLMAGPGTITTAMSFSASKNITHLVMVILIYGLLALIAYACFLSGKRIVKLIGENSMLVITKMMGLILSVIGVQMFAQGANELFHWK
ncbi:multiple antibiotic resistance protein [Chitinophaga skermanii]|uniref:UPF0056 membrane protein n=1 Tax=Chitinophaga skermanii TaxID=331697 RepID=A0A327R520_9BACT|nr:MarC family protein [Chitinophaga skermanii]RAJ10753.1 multiple antibiotic resistance protein [Chitinophaga skermanii]